jgi:Fungal specific transcription factor domain
MQSGYIRAIELALSWCVFNVAGCESTLKELLRSETGIHLLSNSEGGEAAIKLHRKWRKTAICKAIERLLSGSDLEGDAMIEEEDDEDEDRQLYSESNVLDPDFESIANGSSSLGRHAKFPGSIPLQDDNLGEAIGHATSLGSDGTPKLLLPDNFSQLIDVYFAYTHCWLPVVSRESILKLCYSFPEDGVELSSTTPGAGAYAELWSVLAIASLQTQYGRTPDNGEMIAKEIMNSAQALIPKNFAALEKGHASSLLLLTLFNIGTDDFSSAWVTVGLAIRITLLLRITLEPLDSSTTQELHKSLKLLLLGCFVLETFLSVQLNTIPHLRQQDTSVELLDEEGLDEWQSWTACTGFVAVDTNTLPRKSAPMLSNSVFNQLVRLSFVLNDNITLSNATSLTNPTTSENDLLNWTQQMPAKIRGLYPVSENEPTPHRLNLLLAYLTAKVVCNPPNREVAIEEALPIFNLYARTLGRAVIPPTFTLFASIFQREELMDSLKWHHLNDIKSQVRLVWGDASASISRQQQQQQSVATSLIHTTSPSLQESIQPNTVPHLASTIEDFNSFSDPQTQFALHMPDTTPQSLYDSHPLEPYNSNSLMDLDALFDDLTSFDGGEHQSPQPVFMQNLGFAANANLTDLMTGGFGWSYNPP